MPATAIAAAALTAGAGLIGARRSSRAVTQASEQDVQAAETAIDEQRRQFSSIMQNLSPFVQAGEQGLAGQLALLGLSGPLAQRDAVRDVRGNTAFQALVNQGENAILQNASATGGLRGGNTQAALAQFRPAMLQQAIDAQYNRLGGLAGLGQNSAALTGNAGQASANNISQLLTRQGQARAGGIMGQATAFNQGLQGVGQAAGYVLGNDQAMAQLGGLFAPRAPVGAPLNAVGLTGGGLTPSRYNSASTGGMY